VRRASASSRVEVALDAALSSPEVTFDRVEPAPVPPPAALGRRGQRTTTLAPFGTRP
jgi:hypothetical protein